MHSSYMQIIVERHLSSLSCIPCPMDVTISALHPQNKHIQKEVEQHKNTETGSLTFQIGYNNERQYRIDL